MLVAIPKKTDKVGFRAMRYISLLPVLQKLYVRALQAAVRRERRPHESNILGFEPGRSTAGVTGTLRQVLSKGAEWRVGAYVASADVEGAFDGIWHQDITDALLRKGVHPEVVCALMRESFDLQGKISLPAAPLSSGLEYARGTRQGSVKVQIYGIRYWTMHCVNLQRAGKLRELESGWMSTGDLKRNDVAPLGVLLNAVVAVSFIIYAGLMISMQLLEQWNI